MHSRYTEVWPVVTTQMRLKKYTKEELLEHIKKDLSLYQQTQHKKSCTKIYDTYLYQDFI
jgi:hypothetical protein